MSNNPGKQSPPLLILIAVAAIGPLALNIYIPSMPRVQAFFGVSYGTVQLTLSLYLVGVAVAQLFMGSLSDRFGRRPVLLAGLMLFLAGSLICGFAPSIEFLVAGRVIQAVGGCAGLVLGRAIARDIHDHAGATRLVAHITMAMVVAPMIAPAIGGFVEVWFDWNASFYLVAIVGAAVLIAALPLLHETHFEYKSMPSVSGMLQDYRTLLRSSAFRGYAFNASFSSAQFFAFLAGAPYVVVQIMNSPPSDYGLYFMMVAASYMIGNFLAARLSAKLGSRTMTALGSSLALVGALLINGFALAGVLKPIAIFAPMAIVSFSNGLSLPNAMVGAVSAHHRLSGAASGLAGFLQMAIGALVTLLVGHLQAETPLPMTITMLCSAVAACLALFYVRASARQP